MPCPVSCFVDIDDSLLQKLGVRLDACPQLVERRSDGSGRIFIDIPETWKRRAMPRAARASLRLNSHRCIFEFSEHDGLSLGGCIGSCMSAADVSAFIREWLKQTAPSNIPADEPVGQLELFA